ncbi:MAG: hypothetical protein ABR540_16350 [Acidimicrobiales bacterium]
MAAVGLLVVLLAPACGGGGTKEDPLALDTEPSSACSQAFLNGHNSEGAGRPTPEAFLPSIRGCPSLAEWTAAAQFAGVDLKGREPQFVDNTCNAAGADVQSLRICQEARAAVNDPRQVP